jgi:putative DNA primase/helicase
MLDTEDGTNVRSVGLDPDGIPDEMKTYAHWVLWRFERRDGKPPTKVPYSVDTGRHASTTDSRTWASFDEALEAYQATKRWHGVGFVLSSGDPFVGIDFDKARNPATGEVDPRVLEYVEKFEVSYVEVSVSGTGLHLITRGKIKGGTKKGDYELYDQDRFFTLTGVSV